MKLNGNYNESQLKAINHGNGPMLVISGAGTGKTNLLVGRILHLVLRENVPADSILALTFTEKAAQEMIERVDRELPLGYTEMWIKTFHGFAEAILRERGFEIGLSTDYKILNDVDLWLFLKRHVFDFELEYFRPLGNPQKFLNAFEEHFSRLKDEDITPEQYLNYARSLAQKASDDISREVAARTLELAKAYTKYESLLAEDNSLDFGGLISYALRLFEKRKHVLQEYQRRFQYILVDEFQDTNFAQNKLVTLLADSHRNLLVVGDDDQSIYKWRGAALTNIQFFEKKFPDAKKIVLRENYRSSQPILDLAYRVIQRNNPNRLEVSESIDKKLISRLPKPNALCPEIYHFPSLQNEIQFVLERAENALSCGLDPAILVRTNSLAIPFIEQLKRESLPYQHFSPLSFFNKTGIKDLVVFLRILANPADDMSLFRFLTLPVWKIPMVQILNSMRQAKYENRRLYDMISVGLFEPAKRLIADLIEFSRDHTVSDVLTKFLNENGFLKSLTEDAKGDGVLSDISMLAEKVKAFEERHEDCSVMNFLSYVSLLEYVGDRAFSQNPLDPHAIKILTIHGAKGLEFDSVFVPGLAAGKFPIPSRRDPFEIPEELIKEPLPVGNLHLEEERRLFYVAITRAKHELFLSYSDFYDGKKLWKPSVFIAEAIESGNARLMENQNAPKKRKAKISEAPRKHRSLVLNLPKLSYSQLDTFRTCPLKYQFRYLFHVPAPIPYQLNFGSSIHNTLRDFYTHLQKKPNEEKRALLGILERFFQKSWIPMGYESENHEQEMKRKARKMLVEFLARESKNPIVPIFLEKPFTLKFDGLTIAGRIDRIDRLPDGTFEIIDYKTGENHEKNLEKDLQLSIYGLACRDVFKMRASRLTLYFLESGEKISTKRGDKELEAAKAEILESAKELAASDFAANPGFHCRFCDYRSVCPAAAAMVK